MINIIIGMVIGIVLTNAIITLQKYLKKKGLKINWGNIAKVLLVIYLIYSFIGILISPEYTKPNGNVCKGFNYGIQVCSGDINAE